MIVAGMRTGQLRARVELQKIVLAGEEPVALQQAEKNEQRQADGRGNPLNPIELFQN